MCGMYYSLEGRGSGKRERLVGGYRFPGARHVPATISKQSMGSRKSITTGSHISRPPVRSHRCSVTPCRSSGRARAQYTFTDRRTRLVGNTTLAPLEGPDARRYAHVLRKRRNHLRFSPTSTVWGVPVALWWEGSLWCVWMCCCFVFFFLFSFTLFGVAQRRFSTGNASC